MIEFKGVERMSENKVVEPRTLPGFMELLPEDQIKFNNMVDKIRKSYEKFGFLPLDTPVKISQHTSSTLNDVVYIQADEESIIFYDWLYRLLGKKKGHLRVDRFYKRRVGAL